MPEPPPLIDAIFDQESKLLAVGLAIMRRLSPLRRRIVWSDTKAEPAVRSEVAALMRYMFLVAWSKIPQSDQVRRDAVARLSSAMYGETTPQTVKAGIDYYREKGPAEAFWGNLYRAFQVSPAFNEHVALVETLSDSIAPLLQILEQVGPELDPERWLGDPE